MCSVTKFVLPLNIKYHEGNKRTLLKFTVSASKFVNLQINVNVNGWLPKIRAKQVRPG